LKIVLGWLNGKNIINQPPMDILKEDLKFEIRIMKSERLA
tara:strand:+ start:1329 stop:1448 length:120 start_codon:yes stop_codon:yes gene_type:complete